MRYVVPSLVGIGLLSALCFSLLTRERPMGKTSKRAPPIVKSSVERAGERETLRRAAPEPARVAPAQGSRALSADVVPTSDGRLMLGPKADAKGKRRAMIPDLEEALDIEGVDQAWTSQILGDAQKAMPSGAGIRELDVRCAHTFCRIKMIKPVRTEHGWPEIDRALTSLAPDSEAIFNTELNGALSTGYLYFAAQDSHLPLGNLESNDGEGT